MKIFLFFKRYLKYLIVVTITFLFFGVACAFAFFTEPPISISSSEDLALIEKNPSKRFILTSDLELRDFYPLCNNGNPFTGYFDGNGHTIIGLSFNSEALETLNEIGFISCNKGTIIHFSFWNSLGGYYSLNNMSVVNIGIIAGVNYGKITSCTISSTSFDVEGKDMNVGSICGLNYGEIRNCNCLNNVRVKAKGSFCNVGGVCGLLHNSNAIVEYSKKTNLINVVYEERCLTSVGGIAGNADGHPTISNSLSCQKITIDSTSNNKNAFVGGFVGKSKSISIEDSLSNVEFSSNIKCYFGGFLNALETVALKNLLSFGSKERINCPNSTGSLLCNFINGDDGDIVNSFYCGDCIFLEKKNTGEETKKTDISLSKLKWKSNYWTIEGGKIYFNGYACN